MKTELPGEYFARIGARGGRAGKGTELRKKLSSLASRVRWTKTSEQRFWDKVNKAGPIPTHCPELGPCWIWTGSTRNHYAQISINGRPVRAHRWIYEQTYGDLTGGLDCCHKCDNPICVRLSHLFAGTAKDNAADMVKKGRGNNPQLRKTHCPNGHPYSGDNLYTKVSRSKRDPSKTVVSRVCIACRRAEAIRRSRRRKA